MLVLTMFCHVGDSRFGQNFPAEVKNSKGILTLQVSEFSILARVYDPMNKGDITASF